MIEVQDLTKYFGATLAVNHVSFKVEKGEIIGLLGPNGSGKTTIMRILTGFFPPTSGRALIGGLDVAEHSLETRHRVGYLPENMVLYPDLSVTALLEVAARGGVVIIDKGRIVAQDTPEKLTAKLQGSEQSVVTVEGPKDLVLLVIKSVDGVQRVEERAG